MSIRYLCTWPVSLHRAAALCLPTVDKFMRIDVTRSCAGPAETELAAPSHPAAVGWLVWDRVLDTIAAVLTLGTDNG